jgi:hypothetical protein
VNEESVLLVAAMAGLAVGITVLDLLFSLLRHRRMARARSSSVRPDASLQTSTAEADRRVWIKSRLAAIQQAGNEASPPTEPAGP